MYKKKLQQIDLSKVVKVKLVKLMLGNALNFNNANRFYFTNDGQMDNKIIVGVQAHPAEPFNNPGPSANIGCDVPFASFYNVVTGYSDVYFSGLLFGVANKITTNAYLSLINPEGRFFWYQQPLSSLSFSNMKKYPKKCYSRITLDKCYIELPQSIQFALQGVPATIYQLFTFYYIDDPNL